METVPVWLTLTLWALAAGVGFAIVVAVGNSRR
jgi:hypothetical protein